MFKKRNYRKRVAKRPYRKSAVGRKGSSVSVAVKKYVKSTIHKNMENKSKLIGLSNTFGSYLQDLTLNALPLLPYTGYMTISQGVGASDRVGNSIRVRKLTLSYSLHPTPYDATTNNLPRPLEIVFYLGHTRDSPGILPTSSDINIFFQNNNTTSAPTGSLFDLVTPINSDYFTIVKQWKHKIGYANQSSIPTTNSFNFTNNDYKYNVVKKLDLTKFASKLLKFNDNTATVQGKNLFLMYQTINCDGTISSASQITAIFNAVVCLDYEDA